MASRMEALKVPCSSVRQVLGGTCNQALQLAVSRSKADSSFSFALCLVLHASAFGNRIQAREREITNLSVAGGKARPKNGHHARIL